MLMLFVSLTCITRTYFCLCFVETKIGSPKTYFWHDSTMVKKSSLSKFTSCLSFLLESWSGCSLMFIFGRIRSKWGVELVSCLVFEVRMLFVCNVRKKMNICVFMKVLLLTLFFIFIFTFIVVIKYYILTVTLKWKLNGHSEVVETPIF